MIKYEARMDKNPEDTLTTDSYTTVDAFARYDFNEHFSMSLGLLNMLDEEYIQYSSVAGIPDDGRDLNLYTEPGRTVSARFKVTF